MKCKDCRQADVFVAGCCRRCYRIRRRNANGYLRSLTQFHLPAAPLFDFIRRNRPYTCDDPKQILGVYGTLKRLSAHHLREQGTVSVATADRIACALHVHPYQIWGRAFYEGLEEEVG